MAFTFFTLSWGGAEVSRGLSFALHLTHSYILLSPGKSHFLDEVLAPFADAVQYPPFLFFTPELQDGCNSARGGSPARVGSPLPPSPRSLGRRLHPMPAPVHRSEPSFSVRRSDCSGAGPKRRDSAWLERRTRAAASRSAGGRGRGLRGWPPPALTALPACSATEVGGAERSRRLRAARCDPGGKALGVRHFGCLCRAVQLPREAPTEPRGRGEAAAVPSERANERASKEPNPRGAGAGRPGWGGAAD